MPEGMPVGRGPREKLGRPLGRPVGAWASRSTTGGVPEGIGREKERLLDGRGRREKLPVGMGTPDGKPEGKPEGNPEGNPEGKPEGKP